MARRKLTTLLLVVGFAVSTLLSMIRAEVMTDEFARRRVRNLRHERIRSNPDLTRSTPGDTRKRHVSYNTVEDPDDLPILSRRDKKKKKKQVYFDFSRHVDMSFVRFVLARSVANADNPQPVVISQKECQKYKGEGGVDKYNEYGLRTNRLLDDPGIARDCQTFYAINSAPEDYDPEDEDTEGPPIWPIGVTISDNSLAGPVWNMTVGETSSDDSMPAKIQWIDKPLQDKTSHQLLVSCESWWYQSEVHWSTPQYYGRECRLRIPAPPDAQTSYKYFCVGSQNLPIKDLEEPQPLVYSPCSKDPNDNQKWHIQAAGQEWPGYFLPESAAVIIPDERRPRTLFAKCSVEDHAACYWS